MSPWYGTATGHGCRRHSSDEEGNDKYIQTSSRRLGLVVVVGEVPADNSPYKRNILQNVPQGPGLVQVLWNGISNEKWTSDFELVLLGVYRGHIHTKQWQDRQICQEYRRSNGTTVVLYQQTTAYFSMERKSNHQLKMATCMHTLALTYVHAHTRHINWCNAEVSIRLKLVHHFANRAKINFDQCFSSIQCNYLFVKGLEKHAGEESVTAYEECRMD